MRLLLVFHIYYPELAEYYLQKMKNIHSCRWDLTVTSPQPLSDRLKDEILALNPGAVFLQTENVGYDLWPFIAAIKKVNLDDYDMVIKLHTKNEDGFSIVLNGINMNGRQWKEYMVNALIGDRKRFSALMDIFEKKTSVGLSYSRQLGFISKRIFAEDAQMLDSEISRLGIVRRESHFCAGTMLAFRACALKFLQDVRINDGVFEKSGLSHGGATMAHVYERLIPIAVQAQGYRYFPLYENLHRAVYFKIKDVVTPLLEWIFSINYYGGRDTKAIVVFGNRFLVKV